MSANIHRVVVYLKSPGNVLAHVQSTNGDEWPRPIVEMDGSGVVVPMRRIELEIEATPEELAGGTTDHPQHRSAADLFRKELEYVGNQIQYKTGAGRTGTIKERVAP